VSNLITLAVGFAIAALLGRPVIAVLRKYGCSQHVRDDGPASHLGKEGTPTMGGVLIIIAFIAAFALIVPLGLPVGGGPLLVVATAAAFGLVGFIDDRSIVKHKRSLGLRAREKLALQFAISAVFLYLLRRLGIVNLVMLVPFSDRLISFGWWYYPVAAVFIVFTSNSVNLTDGLDGFASGLAAIAAICVGVIATVRAEPALGALCFALAGACLGFLWYNAYPARVFMGDTGSLALGAALACAVVVLKAEALFLVVGIIFYVEALSVIAQVMSFRLTGKRILRMSPLHHHLELSGWPEPQIVSRLWVLGGLIGWSAVMVERLRPW
jgi:phospho-N-acetylmuramoyl-pentapeptide-transferase